MTKEVLQSDLTVLKTSWRNLLDMVPVAAYTCNTDGRITYFNRFAEAHWGRAAELRKASELYCASHQLFTPSGVPIRREQSWMALALLQGTGFFGTDHISERADGTRTWGKAYAYPLRTDNGQVIGGVAMIASRTAAPEREALVPDAATVAIIEIALAVLAGLSWPAAAFD